MSVDGLVSGMDTTSLITKLLQAEAAPQTQLKAKLATAQTQASAYRTVNTTFAAVRAAAEALSLATLSAGRTATSSSKDVTASAAATAADGSSVTFTVTGLAAKQVSTSHGQWASPTTPVRTDANGDGKEPAWPLEIRNPNGTVRGSVNVPDGATLAEAVTAINAAKLGVSAAAVKLSDGAYRLQLTATDSGTAKGFTVRTGTESDGAGNVGNSFVTVAAQDATLELTGGFVATSGTNTFADLVDGVSVTVSKVDFTTPVTVTVGQDAEAVAGKVKTLADAVNAALNTVRTYTSNAQGSTAALKGDSSLTALAGRLLTAVSSAVGDDGSPAKVGFQLTKEGTITFDKAKFTAALRDTPELAQRMVSGRAASFGPDGVAGGVDDVTAVTGLATRLLDVAKTASDATTGSIVSLANGKESIAKDIKTRIEAWDLRLVKRKEMLTRQFSAMETALSSLKNQSTWLAGQINSLPSSG
jgi:flagellar hook-associated protein 2